MKSSPNHLPSLLSAILFILGGLLLTGIALLMGLTALFSLLTGPEINVQQTIFLLAFGFEAALLFLAAYFVLQKYLGRASADQLFSISVPGRWILILVLVTAVSILIGYLVGEIEIVNWFLLPLLTIPAVALPLGILLALGAYGLPMGRRWQAWSILGLSMTLGPFLLFAMEIVLAIVIFIAVGAYVMTQPELILEMQRLSEQVLILGPDPGQAAEILAPFLTRPAVIVVTLLYISLLVPAVEEIFKPIGVWLFAGKLDSAAQGFSLGALSGAGYALIETIGVSGQPIGGWAGLLFSRIGTGLLHVTTSALLGAAIVLAWRERRYLRLLGTYLLAVLLHGLWNACAMLFSFAAFEEFLDSPGQLGRWEPVSIATMSVLVVALLLILVISNRRLRRTARPGPAELATSPEDRNRTDETI